MAPRLHSSVPSGLQIDLGCGPRKKEGFIGLDCVPAPGVDHVLDLTRDRYPFPDRSVAQVFSSHFLEHIEVPNHVLGEIARVCMDGARIEIWTPYAFTNEAFFYGHKTFFTEEIWNHFCVHQRDYYLELLGGRWLLHNIHYVVAGGIERELADRGIPLDFALRYFKGVVIEFCVEMEFHSDLATPVVTPTRTYSYGRAAPRFPLKGRPTLRGLARRTLGWLKRKALGTGQSLAAPSR